MTQNKIPAVLLAAASLLAQSGDARARLIAYLNGIAHTQLAARREAVSRLHTRADAEHRKADVRAKVLRLIGGLPERHGVPQVKTFGAVQADGFAVEKIAYESLPGFWVTADVYVPASGAGPFPAVVIAPGHGPAGKTEDWSWGGNLARNGIVALAYDPLGQGERLQYYDTQKKASGVGNPTGEHGEANIPAMLLGDDLARYMVNDAMRAVDYLVARKDVDAAHIGAFGCSGGGTATAYFAALDDRVKVAATACYITSFEELLNAPTGVQDAEQSIPHFIERGLDFGDWVELAAPKPYAIVSTTSDMFPFEGARQTFEEAKRVYTLYGAEDRIQWITGPGGHGNLGPIAPAILGFMTKNLKGAAAEATYTPLRPEHPADMICTPTGQVSTSIGGEAIFSLNKKRAESVVAAAPRASSRAELERLQTRLRSDIRTLTGATAQPGGTPPDEAPGTLTAPEHSDLKPAVLMLGASPKVVEQWVQSGHIVLAVEPRPTPAGTESIKSPYLGAFNLLSLRAFLVGKTLVGMRIDDAIHALDWLCARKDVDRSAISVYGDGASGMAALHAAVLDSRIHAVTVEKTLGAYRMIVDQPLHRNVSEVVIPGVLRKYDVAGLLLAAFPRAIAIVDPRDALGEAVSPDDFRKGIATVLESDRKMGVPERIQVTASLQTR
ncbi:MAG: acetylxylan esterase [Candidatus Sulfopaludibacter sp.]|nr:acetylxylan esterase [Candidatus Sulfopaludibacter sp.]